MAMTREEIKEWLEKGNSVSYHVWTFWKTGMGCWDEYNCCADNWDTIEEALDRIESFAPLDEVEKNEW